MSARTPGDLSESSPPGQSRPCAHSALRVYDVFANVEGLQIRVPKPLLGFIPFGVSKRFGLYVVMMLAAPASSEAALLLSLAKAALAEEFAPISRSSPDAWRIQQLNCREVGAAPPMFQQPGCVDQDWGALWYELGDEVAKHDRYELAKTRLWDDGFKVTRLPSMPR
ncbi:MAG: hypothetical protein BMS9Abin14_240 [Gammaproteobacteria bacterium]|nr:MAG: hypothetical protein BMS9Abin14_240 [Gammaproteobacteria bacterium]